MMHLKLIITEFYTTLFYINKDGFGAQWILNLFYFYALSRISQDSEGTLGLVTLNNNLL